MTENHTLKLIKDAEFGGERPLFESHHLLLDNVTVHAGESAIKECSDIHAVHCRFEGKYPFWHVDGFSIRHCLFTPGARAALWYSRDLVMEDCTVDAPKMFREMDGLVLRRVHLNDALETLWHCRGVEMDDVKVVNGDYLLMHSSDIRIDNYRQQGNYSFQYCRNVEIHNAVIDSRDAFWMTEDVTVYDSEVSGEFLGWHSKRLKFVRCRIGGTQPLCYCRDLVLENCTLADDCDLAFEYSTLHADIRGHVHSIKNPTSGRITADSIGQIILDGNAKAPADCIIETRQ